MTLFDVTLLTVGYIVLRGLGLERSKVPDIRVAPLAFLTGWTVTGVALSLLLPLGIDPSITHTMAIAVVVAGGALLFSRRPGCATRRSLLAPRRGHFRRRGPSFRRMPLTVWRGALLAGLGLIVLTVAGALFERFRAELRQTVVLVAVVAAICVLASASSGLRSGLSFRRLATGAATAIGAAVLALAAVGALIVAVKGEWPSEWDSWGFWIPRAETIYYWHGLDNGVGGWGAIAHPEYPPLLAVMYVACWHFAGGFHPSVLPLQLTLLAIAFVGGVLVLLDRHVPRWISFPSLALLAASPGFWSRTQTLMADPALAYLAAAAAVILALWLVRPDTGWLPLATIFLAGAALTKEEGASLGLLLASITIVTGLVLRGRGTVTPLVLLLGPAAVVPWRIWLAMHRLPTSSTDYTASSLLHPLFLAGRTHRLSLALAWLTHSIFRTSQWLLVLPLALVAIVAAARSAPVVAAAVVAWLGLGYFGLATIYWIGKPDIGWYLQTSADRVDSTLVVVAGSLTPLLLALGMSPRAPVVGKAPERTGDVVPGIDSAHG
jgi:hypothetical protein